MSLPVRQESQMGAFEKSSTRFWLLFLALFTTVIVPCRSFAHDNPDTKPDKNANSPDTKADKASNPDTKPATKVETPAPLTDRERWLLDQLEELKKRVTELEAKGNPLAAPAAEPVAQPGSAQPATA